MSFKDDLLVWHGLKAREVFDVFCGLPGAVWGRHWCFVPGSRDPRARVLLVAHCDTVLRGQPTGLEWVGNLLWGHNGTGSDDRAGVAMLWDLRASGHSLLLCDLEESGGVGASECVHELGVGTLGAHAFAVEIDRRGDCEWVTYGGTSSGPFSDWLRSDGFPGWESGLGSFTDIATICPAAGICGVNIAAGYLYQHSARECLIFDAWLRSLVMLRRMLAMESYPSFEPDVFRREVAWWESEDVEVYAGGRWKAWDGARGSFFRAGAHRSPQFP